MPAVFPLTSDSNLAGVKVVRADVSGKSFRLDLVETGEQRVVTDTILHGKAVISILAPLRPDMLHRTLADIEKALIRSCSPVTTRRAAPVDRAVREAAYANTAGVHTTYRPPTDETPRRRTLYFPHADSARHLRRLDNGYWGRPR